MTYYQHNCRCRFCVGNYDHPVASAVNDKGARLKLTDPDGNVTYSSLRYKGGHETKYVIFHKMHSYANPGVEYWSAERRKDERAVDRHYWTHKWDSVVVKVERHTLPDHTKVLEVVEEAMDRALKEHADERVIEHLAHALREAGNLAGEEATTINRSE